MWKFRNRCTSTATSERALPGSARQEQARPRHARHFAVMKPIAGYMRTASAGVELEAVYFHTFPYTGDRAKAKGVEIRPDSDPLHRAAAAPHCGFLTPDTSWPSTTTARRILIADHRHAG